MRTQIITLILLFLSAGAAVANGDLDFKVLHSFDGRDGRYPALQTLVAGPAGELYGMTASGGDAISGTLYKISRQDRFRLLYTFRGGLDGEAPSGLSQDAFGSLFGTTTFGGAYGCGTAFWLSPLGRPVRIHNFDCTDGNSPNGPAPFRHGLAYGATSTGGLYGFGSVYSMTRTGHVTPLYAFAHFGPDDVLPCAGLMDGGDGYFYGTTLGWAEESQGTVFRVSSGGQLTTLHAFTGGADGGHPVALPLRASDGKLYGTTVNGGEFGNGVIYSIDAGGTFTVVHTFTGGADGFFSYATLIQGKNGRMYGTVANGGTFSLGTIFELTLAGEFRVLYNFSGGADGGSVMTGLVETAKGTFYGVTSYGGQNGLGTIYRLRIH